MIPLRSIAIVIFSLAWLGISIQQWAVDYPDLSSLLFALGLFFVGLYAAYDQWHKETVEEMKKDIQAIDKKCNDLEVKVIEIKNKGKK